VAQAPSPAAFALDLELAFAFGFGLLIWIALGGAALQRCDKTSNWIAPQHLTLHYPCTLHP
jgi:hypothetical protein